MTFDCINIWRFPYYINKPSLFQIGLQLFKWGHFHIFSLSYNLTSDNLWPCLGTWPLTAWTYEGSHIISINQVWFKLVFNFSNEAIFTSYNLTSDDLWSWYMTFDLINKWGFPCCIYDPTLVEIHQIMWNIEPNINPFHNRTDNNNINRQQQGTKWSLCVFPAKAGDTKSTLIK